MKIHERYIQVLISTVKTLSFQTYHLDKQCKLRSACSSGISLIRVYTVVIPSGNCCRIAITGQKVGQRPVVLAGTGWKLFHFLGHFLTLTGFCQELNR